MSQGPLMIDVAGVDLSDEERRRLQHPLVGGVILFSRNYSDKAQLRRLCDAIHGLQRPPLLIAVDHEGGRVQRFRDGFSALPPLRTLGLMWDEDSAAAVAAAQQHGRTLAAELLECGVDLSFAPVLDLDWGRSSVIGDRALHRKPQAVIELAAALMRGMGEVGMACCGKHFPGHGWVAADSHVAMPVDERSLEQMAPDLEPWRRLQPDAVMPAHVIYAAVDELPAGFSSRWLNMLRQEFGFDGAIFSDDLSMAAAGVAGGPLQRVEAAWRAGCDMLLLCNDPAAAQQVLEQWRPQAQPQRAARIAALAPAAASPRRSIT